MFYEENSDFIISELENKLKKFIVYNPGMNLKKGEVCYFQGAANAVNIKNVVVGTARNSTYVSLRKYGLGTGFSNTSNVRGNVAEKYPGYLFITNQRFVLSALKYSFEIPLVKITTLNFMADGFTIMSNGKTYVVETEEVNKIKKLIQLNNEYMMRKGSGLDNATRSFTPQPEYRNTEKVNMPERNTIWLTEIIRVLKDLNFSQKWNTAKAYISQGKVKRYKKVQEKEKSKYSKILLIILAVFLALFMILSLCIELEFEASVRDLWLYRLAIFFVFAIFELGILLELNILNLKWRIPLIRSDSIIKHGCYWGIIFLLSVTMFGIPYEMTSYDFKNEISARADEEATTKEELVDKENAADEMENFAEEVFTWKQLAKNQDRYKDVLFLIASNFPECEDVAALNAELETEEEKQLVTEFYQYYDKHLELPIDFQEAFTEFCVGEEYEDMFVEDDHPFYNAVSLGFQISWKVDGTYYIDIKPEEVLEEVDKKDEIITDEDPLIFSIDCEEYTVGSCTFSIDEIQVASFPFKIGSRSVFFRIYGKVKNNSNKETFFSATKAGNIVGTYYGEEEELIGGNHICRWKDDTEKDFSTGYTLGPGEERELKIQATYTTTEFPTYEYKLNMDLYFRNDDNLFTLTVN